MKTIQLVLCMGLLSLFAGCEAEVTNTAGDGGGGVGGFQAVCDISNGTAPVICVDFQTSTPANETNCNGAYVTQYASDGANSAGYVTVNTPGVSISCGQINANPIVGSCTFSDHVLRYYSSTWSNVGAQSDCANQSGVWGS